MRRSTVVSLIALAFAGTASLAAPPDEPARGRGRTFISPMGEPFRSHSPDDPAPDLAWFQSVDTNHDGHITLVEFRASAARFFATLDLNKDGEIDPDELEHYETEVAPEVRMSMGMGDMDGGGPRGGGGGGGRHHGGGRMGGGGGHMGGGGGHMGGPEGGGDGENGGGGKRRGGGEMRWGAGRFGYFDLPEPVASADSNLNRGVSAKEFDDAAIHRFALLDTANNGYLSRDTLPKLEREGDQRRRRQAPPPSEEPSQDYTG